jgi:oligoendopeptidase F
LFLRIALKASNACRGEAPFYYKTTKLSRSALGRLFSVIDNYSEGVCDDRFSLPMRTNMSALAAALFLIFSAHAFAAAPASLEQQWADKEHTLEDLYAQYWRTEYQIARGNSQLSSLEVQKQIREAEIEPHFLARLKAAKFRDPILRRRQQLFLEEALVTQISSDPVLAKLVEEITHDEAAMSYDVGGKPMTRSELNNLLGHEPDRELRRKAWLAQQQLTAKTGERIRSAMEMRRNLAAKYSDRSFVNLMLARKGIRIEPQLLAWFEDIQRATESEYQKLLARIRTELKLATVEPWDLDYYFSTLTGSFEEKKFVPERAWEQAKHVAATLGYDFDKLPVDTTITEITFGGGTYPIFYRKEVKILVNKYQGLRFVDTLFHESGHALHYSFDFEPQTSGSSNPSFILQANMAEPFDEGLGQVMSLMIYRPQFAGTIFALTPAEITSLNESYRLKSLYDMRSTIADSMFEFAAYKNPGQDLAALYDRVTSKYLGVPIHGGATWAFDPFYSSGPIYLQSYVLAEMAGRQVHHTLTRRFGSQWGVDAGAFLKEKFFTRGGRLTLDELMREGTGEPLTDKYLIQSLTPSRERNRRHPATLRP